MSSSWIDEPWARVVDLGKGGTMNNQIILKVKSGAVIDAYATGPVQMTVVDVDMLEPGDSEEVRMKKSVFDMPLDGIIGREDVDQFIKDIALCEALEEE
jgi:hypothetical protein